MTFQSLQMVLIMFIESNVDLMLVNQKIARDSQSGRKSNVEFACGYVQICAGKWFCLTSDKCWNNCHNLGKGLGVPDGMFNPLNSGTRTNSQIVNITGKGAGKTEWMF